MATTQLQKQQQLSSIDSLAQDLKSVALKNKKIIKYIGISLFPLLLSYLTCARCLLVLVQRKSLDTNASAYELAKARAHAGY